MERIKHFCKTEKKYQIGLLSERCKVPNLSKYLNKDTGYDRTMPYQQYAALAFYGITSGWLGSDADAYYKDFFAFLGMDVNGAPRTSLESHYVVYRFSFLAPGFILKGPLNLTRDVDTVAVRTDEFHRIQIDVARRFPFGAGAETDFKFPRSGHLFPRGGNEYLMISRKDGDGFRNQIQTSYLQAHGNDLNSFEGPFSDFHGTQLYFGYMIATKADFPLANDDACALETDAVDPEIVKVLREGSKKGTVVGDEGDNDHTITAKTGKTRRRIRNRKR